MTDSIQKPQQPCRAEFKCHYKVDNNCVFWDRIKALLSVMQGKYHKKGGCVLDLFDTDRNPCSEPDEEEHNRGATDIVGQ